METVTKKVTIDEAEKVLEPEFKRIQDVEKYNFEKVLNALISEKVGEQHFSWVTGYGHDDLGREKIDDVFAKVFNAESGLVRPSFASGTHVISCGLFGLLRPGDEIVAVCGTPYDSLHEVMGIYKASDKSGSLTDFGVKYKEIPLNSNFECDIDAIPRYVTEKTKLVFIQRSKGYENRKSLLISDIEKIVSIVKKTNKDIICFVDNCFGEFTEKLEPTDVGADILCGSLIKNIGAGIVPAGGYIVGKSELVELAAERHTAPGIAGEGGCMFDLNRIILQGLFLAPHTVSEVLKGVTLASYLFSASGFKANPKWNDVKTDIVVSLEVGNREFVERACKLVQSLSPVNSHLTPEACNLPGYPDEVIMAGGTFIEGSTVELTCDAPMREPYILYWQGGLNYNHSKLVLEKLFS